VGQWYLEYSEDYGRTIKRVESGLPDNVYPSEEEARNDAEYLLTKRLDAHYADEHEDPDPNEYQVYVISPYGNRYRYEKGGQPQAQ
jgi:hypothetical protein